MSQERIYLDHAAGGWLLPKVQKELLSFLVEIQASPTGGHREGREAREQLEIARKRVADFIGAKSFEDVIFTSGGTESVQSAIRGWGSSVPQGTIYVSEIEHPAVESAVRRLGESGFQIRRVQVDPQGRLKWDGVKVGSGSALVCVHLAHHDLGTIQNLGEAKEFADRVGAKFFVDATHAAGWVSLDVEKVGADLVALSGHRLGGPKGTGALWIRPGTSWVPWLEGGRQEGDRRGGTENLPAIVGFGVAAEEWVNSGEKFRNSTRKAQKVLADGIRKKISLARLHGPEVGDSRSPAHLAFSFAGLEAESLALVLDRVGLAARGGSGCVTREMRIPPAMRAIGAKPEEARALILFTLGPEIDLGKISKAVDLVKEAVQRLTSILPS
jgi:cysteine desulfurase